MLIYLVFCGEDYLEEIFGNQDQAFDYARNKEYGFVNFRVEERLAQESGPAELCREWVCNGSDFQLRTVYSP